MSNALDSVGDDVLRSEQVRTVWEEKVAGFTLHTFSPDFKEAGKATKPEAHSPKSSQLQELKTEFVTYTGQVLHSFSVTRGSGPGLRGVES